MATEYPENLSFPIVGYNLENGSPKTNNIYGTASYLKNNIFITAGHSILNAKESEFTAIAFRDKMDSTSNYIYHTIEQAEIFEDLDIGIVKLKKGHINAKADKWTSKSAEMLGDVFALGYPFGYNISENEFVVRGLQGYIVTKRRFHEFQKKPSVYELSFHCPKGISGASLKNSDSWHVMGFIIANASTEILVYEEKEIDETENKKTIYEKYETTKYGIAITVDNLLDRKSSILKTTFREYLEKEGLLE
ncbi:hypothetical protein [Flagellimonas pacifica]|uniref:Serine protease n=1 Tax=Flagellimonas pacifica TaxID=1247520 RepID=A0A285MGW5_9FLAO|nr:hypothetical protein [Allomuricauda parva]SNY94721.1 hypothetical protein SAMN06265377_0381 [Allomuricauda parva]